MADRTALVIGASRGIGLGLVKELAGRGWRVTATLRSPASAEGLTAFAAASGGAVRLENLDLEDAADIDALAGRLAGQAFDLVFINAGIGGPRASASTAKRDDIATLFMTNTIGPIHAAEALAAQVTAKTGVIAFMSSGLGSVAAARNVGAGLYSASKAALNRLARDFADRVRPQGVTVLVISPGWVRTDMGGPGAAISVEESAKGVIDVVEAKAGTGADGFWGHDGAVVPW